ncbi:MAG TPA: nucleoside triphosphate pyrophosphohydrolase [Sphingomonadales bacterium]|nr:nucleoside triphosphate pyrophosphohydrolase [Sphingomonadales bacterium]
MQSPYSIADLLAIMTRLRDPENGCPWDIEQDFKTIAPYTIEEAYEVAAAIDDKDMEKLKDELGDLLFQVVYHAEMAREAGEFGFQDVVEAISGKMVRRHPHVFGDADIKDAETQTSAWEAHKALERDKKGHSLLDDVPSALPALLRAQKLQKRAARVGFDWPTAEEVLNKVEEEIAELRAEVKAPSPSKARTADEVGDILFALVNLARWLKVDAEEALRATNTKFKRRFKYIEDELAKDGRDIKEVTLGEMEALWQEAKTKV